MKKTQKKVIYALMGLCLPFIAHSQCTYSTDISTVAGSHVVGYSGNDSAGTAAKMNSPWAVLGDASGNLYIADYFNHAVRRVDQLTGIITTVAGTGVAGFSGDSSAATAAQLNGPAGLGMDAAGNLYIADKFNERIRKVDAVTGVITTVVGNGFHGGWAGHAYNDGGPATAASLTYPIGVTFDCANHMYITDNGSASIRRVNLLNDTITLFAGTHAPGYNGDTSAATASQLNYPSAVAVDCISGDVYISDAWNNRIRKVSALTGMMTTYAGTGDSLVYEGDGGAATAAKLWIPWGITLDACGNLFICDYNNNVIRKVDGGTGVISRFAGSGVRGYDGDGAEADSSEIYLPSGMAIDGLGNVYIADYGNYVVRLMGTHPYASRAYVHGTTQDLNVNQNDGPVAINTLMSVPVSTGAESWSVSAYPMHGTLAGFPATSTATTGTAIPSGLTYMPSPTYVGDDQFTIVMSDGNTKASTTVNVKVAAATAVINTNTLTAREVIAPNPNNGSFKCEFISTTDCKLDLVATDVTGRVIYTQKVNAVTGANTVSINLPSSVSRPAMIMVSLGNNEVKFPNTKMVITE